ncbi:uncharacterized protein LOC128179369 [Crassostrea angulata]|uniref:Beta-microseminoprotein n=1 Tax=Magallana gigas TaxID=29159 RepID=A0A8W8J368_MAGGI|nr:uncharacterized protein LOC105333740 [Crassostrea gigas]XP_052702742.1 uncharacterized protein LOC128179369 [Crassostrea angulata]|eukprot:XP_011435187.1 PREDICTED: uncharacterized protein LOC105333740 [Crassostrea gigas]
MWLVWVFLIVSGFVWLAEGSCYNVLQPPRNLNGCVDDEGHVTGLGKTKFDYDTCFRCTCVRGALNCCGFGYRAGIMNLPGCRMKRLPRCEFTFVSVLDGVSQCGTLHRN